MAFSAKHKRIIYLTVLFIVFFSGLRIKKDDFPKQPQGAELVELYGYTIGGHYWDIEAYTNFEALPYSILRFFVHYKYMFVIAVSLVGFAIFIASKEERL